MKRLSLFNHEKRISDIERALGQCRWYWTAVACLAGAVLMLTYAVIIGHFP
jgi:hypothetical protein